LPHMSLEMNDLPRNNQAEGQAVKSKRHKPKGLRQFSLYKLNIPQRKG
jgi:hypothetical protein